MSSTPTIAPMTMPAIAPPEIPELDEDLEEPEAECDADDVVELEVVADVVAVVADKLDVTCARRNESSVALGLAAARDE